MPSPIQTFEANIRPAELLLRVYRLLECENIAMEGEMVEKLRGLVKATPEEELLLVYNEIFVGLVRESANMRRADLKRAALDNLLRQAVVAASTGLDSYLPALLRVHLPLVIEAQGRTFLEANTEDKEFQDYFKTLTYSLSDTLRIIEDPQGAPLFIANKILGYMNFKYLSSSKGINVVGTLLGVPRPWEKIAQKLDRDQAGLQKTINNTAERRDDIVHRADRPQSDMDGEMRVIDYSWTLHAVETIRAVCLALDELVRARIGELSAEIERRKAEEANLDELPIDEEAVAEYLQSQAEEAAEIAESGIEPLVDDYLYRLLDAVQQQARDTRGIELDDTVVLEFISSRLLHAVSGRGSDTELPEADANG